MDRNILEENFSKMKRSSISGKLIEKGPQRLIWAKCLTFEDEKPQQAPGKLLT